VEGDFVMNEFGSLTPNELHFLRVFIYCEGRIRDMEAALGVSYPTVKGHLASIKEKLNLSGQRFASPAGGVEEPSGAAKAGSEGTAGPAADAPDADEVLDKLEGGQISYKDAIKLLKTKKKGGKHDEQVSG
jgi:hypothetical protein